MKVLFFILLLLIGSKCLAHRDTIGVFNASGVHLETRHYANDSIYIWTGTYTDYYNVDMTNIDWFPLGGVVNINSGGGGSAWLAEDPTNHKVGCIGCTIHGDALPGITYGFVITAQFVSTAGICFQDSSKNNTIIGVYIHGGLNNGSSIGQGIALKTYPAGIYFNRGNGYNMGVNKVINCKIVGTVNEAIYAGCSHYGNVANYGFTPVTTECAMDSFFCYGNIIDSVGWSAMNVGGVTGLATVHDNLVTNFALLHVYGHVFGININPGTVPKVYNNKIFNTLSHAVSYTVNTNGIDCQGQGGLYYNNQFKGTFAPFLILRCTDISSGTTKPDVYIINNTSDSSGISVWAFSYNFGAGKIHLYNNAISTDSVHYTMDGNNWTGMDTLTNKLSTTTAAMGYVSPSTSDYRITSTSILRSGGTNETSLGITSDAENNPRPSSGSWSFGKSEYTTGSIYGTYLKVYRK